MISIVCWARPPARCCCYLQGRIVRVLIKAGANVNGRQSTGHTPLHCCAMEGQECMMKDLLQAGANPTLASVEGQTPLHTAAQVRPLAALMAYCCDRLVVDEAVWRVVLVVKKKRAGFEWSSPTPSVARNFVRGGLLSNRTGFLHPCPCLVSCLIVGPCARGEDANRCRRQDQRAVPERVRQLWLVRRSISGLL